MILCGDVGLGSGGKCWFKRREVKEVRGIQDNHELIISLIKYLKSHPMLCDSPTLHRKQRLLIV